MNINIQFSLNLSLTCFGLIIIIDSEAGNINRPTSFPGSLIFPPSRMRDSGNEVEDRPELTRG